MTDPIAGLFLGAVALVAVGIPIVYLVSRALKMAPPAIALDNPRRELRVAALVVVVVYAITVVSLFLPLGASSGTDPGRILAVAVMDGMLLATVFVAARLTRQPWAAVGLSRRSPVRMLVLGLVPSALFVPSVGLMYYNPGAGLPGAGGLAVALVWTAIVGFSEEVTFRGYLQTRFEAAWGTWAGYAAAVVVFAFAHFPGSYVLYSGNVLSALLSALGRVGLGLLLGFFYLRSRSVVPGAISHMFYNWALVLWQIPNA